MTEVSIRPFDAPRDIEAVMEIWLKSNIEAHPFVGKSYWIDSQQSVRQMIIEADEVVVAFDPESCELLGFCGIVGDKICGMFVESQHRGCGIGHELMEQAKLGHERLTLNVYAQNPRAIMFYQREGFEGIGFGEDSDTGAPEVTMRWISKDRFKLPDDLEDRLAQAREELGEDGYQRLLEQIRESPFTE